MKKSKYISDEELAAYLEKKLNSEDTGNIDEMMSLGDLETVFIAGQALKKVSYRHLSQDAADKVSDIVVCQCCKENICADMSIDKEVYMKPRKTLQDTIISSKNELFMSCDRVADQDEDDLDKDSNEKDDSPM